MKKCCWTVHRASLWHYAAADNGCFQNESMSSAQQFTALPRVGRDHPPKLDKLASEASCTHNSYLIYS